MVDQPLLDAAQWAANLAFWAAVLFPALTATFWSWWQSEWGWNTISFDAAFGLTALPYMVLLNWHVHGSWLAWTEVLAMSLGFALAAWRTYMIFKTQRRRPALSPEPEQAR